LSADFIRDLLTVTGGACGKPFADIREHALIRVLTEDLRRTEVTEMRLAGWRSRSMVDRYGADMADQRAQDAKRRMGDMY
jgi:hypothetical protein